MNTTTDSIPQTRPDHRVFDEFDVSKALRLPCTDDQMAIIETVVADRLTEHVAIDGTDAITDCAFGFKLDDCGNRRMQATIEDRCNNIGVTIDVTGIVDTLFTILNSLMTGRMRKLQNSYDRRYHCGIYADDSDGED